MTKLHKGIKLRAVRIDYKFKLGFILISAMPFVATVFLALNYAFPNITAREDVIRVQIILAVTGCVFLLGLSMLSSLLPQVIKVPFWAKMVEEDTSNYRIEGNWEKKDTELFDFLDEMSKRLEQNLSEIQDYARVGKLPQETFKKRLSAVSLMLQVSSAINCAATIENVLNMILEGICKTLKLDRGLLVVFDEVGEEVISRMGYNLTPANMKEMEDKGLDKSFRLFAGDEKVRLIQNGDKTLPLRGIGKVYPLDKTLPLDPSLKGISKVYPAGLSGISKVYPLDKRPRAVKDFMKACGLQSMLVCPLISGKRHLGEIIVGKKDSVNGYGRDDLRIAELFGRQATIAIENFHLHAVVQELSITDGLTGLGNFRHFHKSLMRELERAQAVGNTFSVVMLDIDHFKICNDRYGHLAGDAILQELGEVLKKNSRAEDIIARYGGEEFVMILPNTSQKQVIGYAERLRRTIEGYPFLSRSGHEPLYLTVSIGIATFPEDGNQPQELIYNADQALYGAKELGRNCVCSVPARSQVSLRKGHNAIA